MRVTGPAVLSVRVGGVHRPVRREVGLQLDALRIDLLRVEDDVDPGAHRVAEQMLLRSEDAGHGDRVAQRPFRFAVPRP
jgi:hypothetical protein